MSPLERWGLRQGWDTIIVVAFGLVIVVGCSVFLSHTITTNGTRSQQILMDAVKTLSTSDATRAANQKNISDHLDVINQRDQLIIDRLVFEQSLLEDLRKRGR